MRAMSLVFNVLEKLFVQLFATTRRSLVCKCAGQTSLSYHASTSGFLSVPLLALLALGFAPEIIPENMNRFAPDFIVH